MWQTMAEKATDSFWRSLGLDLFKSAVTTAVVEATRSQVIVWRDMKLKRKRRALDLIYRNEDDLYRDRREAEKKSKEEAQKPQKKEQSLKEEDFKSIPLDPLRPSEVDQHDGTLGLFDHSCEG